MSDPKDCDGEIWDDGLRAQPFRCFIGPEIQVYERWPGTGLYMSKWAPCDSRHGMDPSLCRTDDCDDLPVLSSHAEKTTPETADRLAALLTRIHRAGRYP